jgi:AraC family transcriptional regulator
VDTNAELVDAVMAWAEDHLQEPLGVAQLARRAGYSLHHFSRLFSARTGEGPAEWIERRRIERARRLLLEGPQRIIEVALACGFNDAATFTRAFRRRTGTTPSRFRSQGPHPSADAGARPPIPEGLVAASWIEETPSFRLCGLVSEVRGEAEIPGMLWTRLRNELSSRGHLPRVGEFRQVAFWMEEPEERFSCLVGFVADPDVLLPLPFVSIDVPAATCLVFQVPGPPEHIAPAYQEIYGALLPSLTWRPSQTFAFERYPAGQLTEIALPVSQGVPGEPSVSGIA